MQEDEEIPEYQVVVFDDKENNRMTFTLVCDGKKIGKTTITKSVIAGAIAMLQEARIAKLERLIIPQD